MTVGHRRPARWWAVLAIALATVAAPARARAQQINGMGGEEIRLLREAAGREAAGDLEGAEEILRGVLDARPTSLSGLLSLERVLRMQGRTADLLPAIDRLLADDPTSAVAHQLRVRTLSHLDRVDALERATEAWIRVSPKVETPYREIARVWAERGEHARALRVLERGRDRVGRRDALALEMGDAHAALGAYDRAIREWDRAIGADARGFSLVRRRLGALPDGGAQLLPGLIEALTRDATPQRLRAATELAIDAGLAAQAERVGRQAVAALPAAERGGFLVEVARRADGARLPAVAYWAYAALLEAGGPDRQMLAIRSRLADLALAMGDTATARRNYHAVEQAYPAGAPERRQAAAVRIELTAREGNVEEAMRELRAFRRTHPDAPELDAIAAALAEALAMRGRLEEADRILAGATGPRTGLVRGRLALLRGEVGRARSALLAAAPKLEGAEATETIALVTLLGRLGPEGGELLGRATTLASQGEPAEAVALLVGRTPPLARAERAALLDFAAGLADRHGLPAEAEQVRRTIVVELADTQEAPAALLALARVLMDRPGGHEEARQLLERLVLEYPRSALVPQARRELDRLHRRVPRS